jgi:hypothetical protein
MSTVAPAKSSGYEVARPQGQCTVCASPIIPKQRFMAALTETPTGFVRADCCQPCWEKFDRQGLVAYWQAVMPEAHQKRQMFVDDTVLCELFERLSAVEEPAKLNFRFVLGLVLMRKRLVVYENSRQDAGREIWAVRLKGRQELLDMVNPRLDEQQVREVSGQLGEILNQEL